MRQKLVAGNWKMNKSLEEGLSLASEVAGMYQNEVQGNVQAIVIPPFIGLNAIGKLLGDSGVKLGAQNCHQSSSGAYTGEVSASMLKSVGVQYVVLGHSERRQFFGEEENLLKQKIDACLTNELTPIYCYGETLQQRESGQFWGILEHQLKGALQHLTADQAIKLVLAYEPVWAIGTGLTASPAQAQDVHAFSRKILTELFGAEVAQNMPILYGGSVKASNALELFSQEDIDGGLIGGASLQSRDFIDIVKAAASAQV